MRPTRQAGFTIVETLLFLAISALLILIITVGQGVTQRQTQFRDAVDSLEAKLVRLQSERLSSRGREGGGDTAASINFLTMVEFAAGSSDVQIRTCTASRVNGPIFPYDDTNQCTVSENYVLKWSTQALSTDTIIFYRTHDTGALRSAAGQTTGAALLAASYGAAVPPDYEVELEKDGFTAGIVINERDATGQIRVNQITKRYD